MSLHVTHVAGPSPAIPETSYRRTAAGKTTAGQPAKKEATATLATRAAASFGSLLESSSPAERSVAAAARGAEKRVAASAASTAASSTAPATSGTTPSATTASPAAATTQPVAPPTAQSVFGANVWMTDPVGLNPNGTTFEYNPIYFATESTAQTVAQMVGGTVIVDDQFCAPGDGAFAQQQPNYMVKMPNGAVINPGLVASFYTFGFSQSQVNTWIAQEVADTPPLAQTT
jgi:hypothetical protein